MQVCSEPCAAAANFLSVVVACVAVFRRPPRAFPYTMQALLVNARWWWWCSRYYTTLAYMAVPCDGVSFQTGTVTSGGVLANLFFY